MFERKYWSDSVFVLSLSAYTMYKERAGRIKGEGKVIKLIEFEYIQSTKNGGRTKGEGKVILCTYI